MSCQSPLAHRVAVLLRKILRANVSFFFVARCSRRGRGDFNLALFLLQVHTLEEMDRVLGIDGVQMIGINNRDLSKLRPSELHSRLSKVRQSLLKGAHRSTQVSIEPFLQLLSSNLPFLVDKASRNLVI